MRSYKEIIKGLYNYNKRYIYNINNYSYIEEIKDRLY